MSEHDAKGPLPAGATPEDHEEAPLWRELRAELQREPLPDLDADFAARCRRLALARERSSRRSFRRLQIAAAAAILVASSAGLWWMQRDPQTPATPSPLVAPTATPALSLAEIPRDRARSIHSLALDVSAAQTLPPKTIAPLITAQLEAFELEEWARAHSHPVSQWLLEVRGAAQSERAPEELSRLALRLEDEHELQPFLSLTIIEAQTQSAGAGSELVLDIDRIASVVARHGADWPEEERSALGEVLFTKSAFVSAGPPGVIGRRWESIVHLASTPQEGAAGAPSAAWSQHDSFDLCNQLLVAHSLREFGFNNLAQDRFAGLVAGSLPSAPPAPVELQTARIIRRTLDQWRLLPPAAAATGEHRLEIIDESAGKRVRVKITMQPE